VVETLPEARLRVALDDEFADYDSLETSCEDYAWLITNGLPYRSAWQQYLQDKNLDALIGAVARTYATAPQYAELAQQIAAQPNVVSSIKQA
jgi:flagellum-specific peptidoglycan hydrolase FlgJ